MGAANSDTDLTPKEEAMLNLQYDENFNPHQENIDNMGANILRESMNDLESGSKVKSKVLLNPSLNSGK